MIYVCMDIDLGRGCFIADMIWSSGMLLQRGMDGVMMGCLLDC